MKINVDKVTRFEVIDETGRAYVREDGRKGFRDQDFLGVKVDLSFQDEGRTLKVFVKGRRYDKTEN
jgi:hypothetical protein